MYHFQIFLFGLTATYVYSSQVCQDPLSALRYEVNRPCDYNSVSVTQHEMSATTLQDCFTQCNAIGSSAPTKSPTESPTVTVTASPTTATPTASPTLYPTQLPTKVPTMWTTMFNMGDGNPIVKTITNNLSDKTFGSAVERQNDLLIVSAIADTGANSNSGAVYVYKFNFDVGEWNYIQELRSPFEDMYNQFGKKVIMNYPYLIASEPWGSTYDKGAIRVFIWNNATNKFDFDQTILASDKANYDRFGYDIALYNDTLVVGAFNKDNTGGNDYGAMYTFKIEPLGTPWSEQQIIVPADGSAYDYFGVSVDINENAIVVGASGYDNNTDISHGAVYVYHHNGVEWYQHQILIATPTQQDSQFGINVAIENNIIAVGATTYDNGTDTDSGVVYIFEQELGSWVQKEMLMGTGSIASDQFGTSIYLKNNEILVGGIYSELDGVGGGAVWNYEKMNGMWQLKNIFYDNSSYTAAGDEFGISVLVYDTTIYIGAKYSNLLKTRGGALFYYDLSTGRRMLDTATPQLQGIFYNIDKCYCYIGTGTVYYGDYNTNLKQGTCYNCETSCTTSDTCGINHNCVAGQCVEYSPCLTNSDCNFDNGRLPYCNEGTCVDKYEGYCTNSADCDNKINLAIISEGKSGSFKQSMQLSSPSDGRKIAKSLTQTIYDPVSPIISVVETMSISIPAGLSRATFLSYVANITCPLNICTTTTQQRRLLEHSDRQLLETIAVQLTYEVDSKIYANMNNVSFDDPSFVSNLATLLGVNTTEIIVHEVGTTVTIEYVLTLSSNGVDPLTQENINKLTDAKNNITTIESLLINTFSLPSNTFVYEAIDYCNGRDCNGRGTCNSATGVCTCTDTNYWGINCETPVSCNSGTKILDAAYCVCQYPHYGERCQNTLNCTSCF